jgi:hypothetical protein
LALLFGVADLGARAVAVVDAQLHQFFEAAETASFERLAVGSGYAVPILRAFVGAAPHLADEVTGTLARERAMGLRGQLAHAAELIVHADAAQTGATIAALRTLTPTVFEAADEG